MADAPSPVERPPPLRVLVVDDKPDVANALAALLQLHGHTVRVAYDGPSGLRAALAGSPDVVLLDLGLPGMDGYEVARRPRQGASGRCPLLVAVTGYGEEEDRQGSLAAGFDLHLVKPVESAALLAALELAGGRRQGGPS